MSRKTISIHEADYKRLGAWQARRQLKAGTTPSFADLVHELLNRAEAGGDTQG